MTASPDEFQCKQIFIAHEVLWKQMEEWARARNFSLDLIPTLDVEGKLTLEYGPDETPTYAFMPKDVRYG